MGAATFATDPPDVLEQHPIGGGTRAFHPRAPGIVAAGRQTQRRTHHSDRSEVTMLIDEPELHREAAPKMSAAFLRNIYAEEGTSWRTKPRLVARRRRFARTRAL